MIEVEKGVVSIAKRLVGINSENPPGNRGECGEYVFRFLKELGLRVERQFVDAERFNVIVVGKGPLLLQGHLDTVQVGELEKWKYNAFGEVRDGKLFGRGSADMKGGVACILGALQKNPSKELNLLFTATEERNFDAVKKAMELRRSKLKHVKYSISAEPTGGGIVCGNKGELSVKVIAKGKAAHGSRPEEGLNAIEKLVKVVPKLKEYEKKIGKVRHKKLGKATLNIGKIRGGAAPNIVPNYAEMCLDRRIVIGENVDKVVKEMRRVVKPLQLKVVTRIEPVETLVDSEIVKLVRKVVEEERMKFGVDYLTGTTELSEMAAKGIKGIVFGTAQTKQAHTENEFISLKDLRKGEKVMGKIIKYAEEVF